MRKATPKNADVPTSPFKETDFLSFFFFSTHQLDKDGDGAIDFNEFVAGLKHFSWIAGGPEAPRKTFLNTYTISAALVGVACISAFVVVSFLKRTKK